MFLIKFLWRNLRGYRLLFALTIIVTVSQVGCDIITALPLKFIPSKVSDLASDPACTYPFLDPVLSIFDTPLLDSALEQSGKVIQPKTLPCPKSSALKETHHSVIGVIAFSISMLIIFGILSAVLAYLALFLAAYIAQNFSARLRNQLFEHLQRLSLDWHGKQKKGDLVQRITGNIAHIEKLMTYGLVDLLAGSLTRIGIIAVMLFLSSAYNVLP